MFIFFWVGGNLDNQHKYIFQYKKQVYGCICNVCLNVLGVCDLQ